MKKQKKGARRGKRGRGGGVEGFRKRRMEEELLHALSYSPQSLRFFLCCCVSGALTRSGLQRLEFVSVRRHQRVLCVFVCPPRVSVFEMQPDGNCFHPLPYCRQGSHRLLHCCPCLCSPARFSSSPLHSTPFPPPSLTPPSPPGANQGYCSKRHKSSGGRLSWR